MIITIGDTGKGGWWFAIDAQQIFGDGFATEAEAIAAGKAAAGAEPYKIWRILDLTPVGRYADGDPRYRFHTSYPGRGVRALPETFDTPEAAHAHGVEVVREYERADPYGNMGEVLGVTLSDEGKYRAVINTYHSNT
jgi:hypothetical protein